MKVLISGAGVAGPTLAYWLSHYGIESTIVERAPELRTGGYIIDFWGRGYDIAGRMGLLPEIQQEGYVVQELRVVGRDGERVSSAPVSVFTRITQGRYISLPRGDLAAAIFGTIQNRVETIFGDSITAIEQGDSDVRVSFERGPDRRFDLVVGADGLHSQVRGLVFGPEKEYEKYLGIKVAAFSVEGYQPRDELVYVMHTEVGQQVARFSMRDNRTLFLFTFAEASSYIGYPAEQKALLRRRFANSGWECPGILAALDSARDFYFDRVSQIRMDPEQGLWTRGRVTLLGDAASCASLLAGEGSGLAMTAAYILAGEIHRANGDYAAAFAQYQRRFAPFVAEKQKAALRLASWFAPKSKWAIFLRNQGIRLLTIPWLADFLVGRDLADHITLPDYDNS